MKHIDQVVLGYIKNSSRRFRLFVANIVTHIWKLSKPDQLCYATTTSNSAHIAFRGLQPKDSNKCEQRFNGPEFQGIEEFYVPKMQFPQRLKVLSLTWKKDSQIQESFLEFKSTFCYFFKNQS